MTAHGVNPYAHAPREVLVGAVTGADAPILRSLAEGSQGVLASVNHAWLTTIYPPGAQAVFALAARIDPFGVTGWRCVLALFDALTALVLVRLLRLLSIPVGRVVWYAANPLLLRETYSGLHMDVLVLPFIIGAVLSGLRGRIVLGGLLCAFASAVKFWPAILVPLCVARRDRSGRAVAAASIASIASMALLWAPVLLARDGDRSGLSAYATSWQSNDGFFRAGIWMSEVVLELIALPPWHSHAAMRAVTACLLLGIVLRGVRAVRRAPRDLGRQALFVVGAVFLLSPTQFPWYWIWCLPLLVVRPNAPLLLYAALLPLYYVQDRIPGIHWIEHGPVWGLLAFEAVRRHRAPGVGHLRPAEVTDA